MKHTPTTALVTEMLRDPKPAYRPIPFWSWNDRLSGDELRRQVALMEHSGVGGYFMHARSGLITEYLEQPWFDSIRTGIEAGQSAGLAPWVYDEEGWPSGFAGGKVTALGDWVYARGLRWRRLDRPEDAASVETSLGVFACTSGDAEIVPVAARRLDVQYTSFVEMTHSHSPHYIDVLNEKAVRAFIDATHEAYAARFPLGPGGLTGFFTDEPRLSEGPIPWSYLLPDAFSARYGYDLLTVLPALYLPCAGHQAVRYDFWALVNELFVAAYMKQIFDWCTAHDCQLTGHMMMEESLYSQMTGTGGSMPFYEFMHMPGVDSLRRNIGDSRIPKQVGSVAEQLGTRRVLTESYALSGWDINFAEMRWIAMWQYLNGVNVMCQHLQGYSLKGARKRDYPPSLFYQQTWYSEYERFNTYLARMGQLLGEGEKAVDVLMIHPMRSAFLAYDGENNDQIRQLDQDFMAACELLSGAHIDYHFGDEAILARHGRLLPDGRLGVGQRAYQAVVLPSCLSLDSTTIELLTRFALEGRPLIYLGSWPTTCQGRPHAALAALRAKATHAANVAALHQALTGVLSKPLWIRAEGADASAIHCCQVNLPGQGTALLLLNTSRTEPQVVTLTLPGLASIRALEMDSLTATQLPTQSREDCTDCALVFAPMEAMLLLYEPAEAPAFAPPSAALAVHCIAPQQASFTIAAMDDNLLTLDACSYQIDGGTWQEPKAIVHLMQELLDLRRVVDVRQRFSFALRCPSESLQRLCLVMEQPEKSEILVNGHSVAFAQDAFYKDISFITADILPHVRHGENTIEVGTRFYQAPRVYKVLYGKNVYETELNKLTYDTELESLYLLGDFSAHSLTAFAPGPRHSVATPGPFVLDAAPSQLSGGDFTTQGLPFFAGTLTLAQEIIVPPEAESVWLDLGSVRAALVQIAVNGSPVKTFLWGPYCADIAPYTQHGSNTLTIKLFASNRNMLGPHHHTGGELYSVGPLSYTGRFSWADRESEAVVITPEMRKQIFWQKDYSFVRFGFE